MKNLITGIADEKRLTRFISLLTVLFILGAGFTVLSMPVSADISIIGFLVNAFGSAAVWFCLMTAKRVQKDSTSVSYAKIITLLKILEYIPFVFLIGFILNRAGGSLVAYVLDFIAVIMWTAALVLGIICSRMVSEKRIDRLFIIEKKNPAHKKNIFITVLEWIDALFWAVFYVFLFNIFIFQLYEIPSESMVPSFMVRDRVFVFKTASGPRFPLSQVRLPTFSRYRKGDIVVLRNPRYERTNQSECKSMFSQFVYMITATKVNLMRTDESGRIIADPLVKRVIGVPGEQLVMVDGVLYSRTSLDGTFAPVSEDAEYACWNLSALPKKEKEYIQRFPLTETQFAEMTAVEELRRNFNLDVAASECTQLARDFERSVTGAGYIAAGNSFVPVSTEWLYLYQQFDSISHKMVASENAAEWFTSFMTDWTKKPAATDPYSEMTRKLNVMFKVNYGKLLLASVQNIAAGFSIEKKAAYEAVVRSLFEEAQLYANCLNIMDQRNMPVFPQNNVIEKHHYFMMGDNRFNSLDLRHSYDYYDRPLDASDPYSIIYKSNMDPVTLQERDILGSTWFRFWPFSRIGLLKRN